MDAGEVMVAKIEWDPKDTGLQRIYADYLETVKGLDDLAFAYRWMATHERRPARRERPRAVRTYAWWHQFSEFHLSGDDKKDMVRTQSARLPLGLFRVLPGCARGWHSYHHSWGMAIEHLSLGLAQLGRLRSLQPGEIWRLP